MRKLLPILSFLVLFPAIAGGFQGYAYLFGGRWQPYEDPLLIDEYGFSDIQNMRKRGKHLVGVSGHTKINSTAITDYTDFKNVYHFRKHVPDEYHFLVYAESSVGNYVIKSEDTEPPTASDFDNDILSSRAVESGTIGRFSPAPQGNIIFTSGSETYIWGGDDYRVSAFLTYDSGSAFYQDFSAAVQNTSDTASNVATVDSADFAIIYIGSTRPLKGINFVFEEPSQVDMTQTTKYWNGTAWAAVTGETDNTNGLTQNGAITFTDTYEVARTKYIQGYALYFYQITTTAGSCKIATVYTQSNMNKIQNIWDGSGSVVAVFKWDDNGTFKEFTDEINVDDGTYVAELDGHDVANDYLYFGFANPQQGIRIKMEDPNDNASALNAVNYWNGSSWTATSDLSDGTTGFQQDGFITWSPIVDGSEFTRNVDDIEPLYWYQLDFSAANFAANTDLNYAYGILSPPQLLGYSFATLFQSRSMLLDEFRGERNKLIYSAYNSPDVWSGNDAGALYFGDETPLTAAATIYNIFRTTGLEQLIITKANETYRMYGDGPSNWIIQQMSRNVGCVAPLSMAVCELSQFGDDPGRHVLIYQSADGVVMNDGAAITTISRDIGNYFDPNHIDAIPDDRIDDSFGWYDPELNAYKLLISSGTGQTTHNVELEFSLEHNGWTKLYRENGSGADPLQSAAITTDSEGNVFSYGATFNGQIYRLENGQDWAGTEISQYVTTKNLLVDPNLPFLADSRLTFFRLGYVDKDEATGETINVIHYCNDSQSATGADDQKAPSAIDMTAGPINTQRVELGPCTMHRFKISASTSNAVDGLEPTGIGIYFDPRTTISGVND